MYQDKPCRLSVATLDLIQSYTVKYTFSMHANSWNYI